MKTTMLNKIENTLKLYLKNQDNLDIHKRIENFKDTVISLDNIAIFLQILDRCTGEYAPINYKNLKNEKQKINNYRKHITNLEHKISDILIENGTVSNKPIRKIFFDNNVKTLKQMEVAHNKLFKFQTNLYDNYGKFLSSKKGQYKLQVKDGFMFKFFELNSDILISRDNLKVAIISYKNNLAQIENMAKYILSELNSFISSDNKLIIDIADDVEKFLTIK